ncbi:MAG: hypothetical protein LAQ30_15275 [Acidobacteriia bacterium]|nr:hypothetical protein [Terriglobia bacterium]
MPEFKSFLFPNLYYGSRLPWILPGYVVHQLFDVTTAKYILHFAFYYAAAFSLYFLLRRATGRKTALLGTIVFCTHSAFLRSIGWDYVDGAGITYCLVGLACVSRAIDAPRRGLWLMLAGMAGAAMVYTQLFLFAFVFFHLAFYSVMAGRRSPSRTIASAAKMLFWYGLGGAILTAALGAINYRLDGNFWFYGVSIRVARVLIVGPVLHSRLSTAPWIGIPISVAVACVIYLIRAAYRKTLAWGDQRSFFIFQYLGACLVMVWLEWSTGALLKFDYYASYLLPFMFLALGCLLAPAANDWPVKAYWCVAVGSGVAFAASIRMAGGGVGDKLQSAGVGWLIVIATIGLVAVIVAPRKWLFIVPALSGLWIYQTAYVGLQEPAGPYREIFQRAQKATELVWPYMKRGPVEFWYDIKESRGLEFSLLNSVYLSAYSMLGSNFPDVDNRAGLQPGRVVAVLSGENGTVEKLDRALKPDALRAAVIAERKVDDGGSAFTVRMVELQENISGLRSLSVASRDGTASLKLEEVNKPLDLPSSGWRLSEYPDGRARLEQRPEGVLVRTAGHVSAYGSWYGPLIAERSGAYRFTLKYRLIQGDIGYSGMTEDMGHCFGSAVLPRGTRSSQTATYALHLKAGEGVVLLISNNPPVKPQSAEYLIEALRAAAVFDEKD